MPIEPAAEPPARSHQRTTCRFVLSNPSQLSSARKTYLFVLIAAETEAEPAFLLRDLPAAGDIKLQ
jgi:hypothetical protein